jgi:hypothetical protein
MLSPAEAKAERVVRAELARRGWEEGALGVRRKGDVQKVSREKNGGSAGI